MTKAQKVNHVGVDVCKEKLDVSHPQWPQPRAFSNTAAGLKKLIALLSGGNVHLVCEPTGGYERLLLKTAHNAEIPISLVNARQVRDFAKAQGKLAKTDALDALVLRQFGEVFAPKPTAPKSALGERLSDITRLKDHLTREMAALKNRLEKNHDRFVKTELKSLLAIYQRRIEKCALELSKLINSDAELREKKKRIESITGLGEGTSTVLISEMPELGTLSDKEASSLAGVAPFNCDSGSKKGQRRIRGGRSLVRRSLYMPALSATRFNPILREFYTGLIARGKAHHVAITAVIRKLIRLVNRLLSDPEFEPQKAA